ncbi:glycosyltransferase [Eggerthella lenta]|nr:glycosyltransferase [Eggerthella lenta]
MRVGLVEPKISIIIPVYNVERYLRECLDSVVNQTLKDIVNYLRE